VSRYDRVFPLPSEAAGTPVPKTPFRETINDSFWRTQKAAADRTEDELSSVRTKTERLRALRLQKEAAEREAAADGPEAKKPPGGRRKKRPS
jgi:hypothetical protein